MRLVGNILSGLTTAHNFRNKPPINMKDTQEEEMILQKLRKDNAFYETVSCLLDDGCIIDDKEAQTAISYILSSIYECSDKTQFEKYDDITTLSYIVAKRFVMTYAMHHIVKFLSTAIHEGSNILYIN